MRDALDAKGMSMREAARATNYDPAYLSRVLNGRQQPSKALAAALDRVLGMEGELADLVVPSNAPRQVSANADIQHMRATVDHFLDHDNRYGGDAVASAAVQVWKCGQRKLDSGAVASRVQNEYLGTLAELAQISGWLLFDSGRVNESRSAFLESHMLALQAGDKPIKWFALDMLAMHGIEHRRPNETLRIADQLLDESRIPPRVALLAHIRKARSLAIAGSRQEAMKEFSVARASLQDSITRRDPSWTWWVDERELTGHEGEALLVLEDSNAAVPKMRQALELSINTDASRRGRLYYSVALLAACASSRAWRDCESTLIDIIPMLEVVASGRSRRRLRGVLAGITHSPGVPVWLSNIAQEVSAML
ncbi:helix-turn-helix domain-containing protein [Streptomyces orinoci]|uniref:Helix-turn-helix transcriptional regulator n=1 Tax=Streptomyces orinoci TaxID=67339 RepID=A0ABV3K660_STRON|nr:helix-turn-helix transcriptional regulator [Streptomyces orinoci]